MSRFYLTLPSNSSMKYYPENTVAQFTTKLSNVIELEGDWEVGLAEISVPSRVENAFNDECYFILRLDTFVHKVRLTARHYEQVKEIIDGLHSALRVGTSISHAEGAIMRFYFDKNRIKIDVAENLWRVVTVEFSPALARLLGFDGGRKYSGNTITADRAMSFFGNINSLYVYCDLLEAVLVGDTKAPLLRIVDKPHRLHRNVHSVLNPILYVPLQKKHFDTVEINIMTDTGLPVPFLPGKSFVVLEFRRAIHPYFAV